MSIMKIRKVGALVLSMSLSVALGINTFAMKHNGDQTSMQKILGQVAYRKMVSKIARDAFAIKKSEDINKMSKTIKEVLEKVARNVISSDFCEVCAGDFLYLGIGRGIRYRHTRQ